MRNCYREKSRLIRTEEVRRNRSAEEFGMDLSPEELSSRLEFELYLMRRRISGIVYVYSSKINGIKISIQQFGDSSFSSRNGQKRIEMWENLCTTVIQRLKVDE